MFQFLYHRPRREYQRRTEREGIAMKLITIAALALSTATALAEPLPQPPQTITCQVSTKFSCAAEIGCGEARLGVGM